MDAAFESLEVALTSALITKVPVSVGSGNACTRTIEARRKVKDSVITSRMRRLWSMSLSFPELLIRRFVSAGHSGGATTLTYC